MAAGLGSIFTKMAAQEIALATIVPTEQRYLIQALDLPRFVV